MRVHSKREAIFAAISLTVTLVLYAIMGDWLAHRVYDSFFFPNSRVFIEGIIFITAMGVVFYSAVLYHVCLIGHYIRQLRHRPATQEQIETLYDEAAPSLSVLVPAYKEQREVMWQTLMSAALSEYPAKRVVLLVDDPYAPRNAADEQALAMARALPKELHASFAQEAGRYRDARDAYHARQQHRTAVMAEEAIALAQHYDAVADWVEAQAREFGPADAWRFDQKFFNEKVLGEPAQLHRARAQELRLLGNDLTSARASHEYARLASLFATEFSSFERKKYVNLSHDANKAMNLNSYMMLIGKSWKEVQTERGLELHESSAAEATFTIPAADYINTIDADSLMTHDYVARLIHLMQQPENSRIAVAQSPCSSIPGSPVPIERVAGACIDVQFHTHQGYTYWDASFWVGANAMLRHTALEAINEVVEIDGNKVVIYIQDRTVIEDTESTIDLVDKGWKLYNYPARLTYSATPADFGSLLIQRRRWANGGLIILPKLLRYVWRSPKDLRLLKELFMRFNYLALTTLGVCVTVLLLFYSFSPRFSSPILLYANLPLFLLYARDLRNAGHRYSDVFRVGALNFMLLPIIAAGVLKQFQQIFTGRKIPFGRTPKVHDRTSAPAIYYLAELALIAYYGSMIVAHVEQAREWQVAFGTFNTCLLIYALVRFIGLRALVEDVGAALHLRPRKQQPAKLESTVVAADCQPS
jgi:cellulose synthase/poly-beta-1,6-N-acetylglucosamine synthase-like glycosyltransferase